MNAQTIATMTVGSTLTFPGGTITREHQTGAWRYRVEHGRVVIYVAQPTTALLLSMRVNEPLRP